MSDLENIKENEQQSENPETNNLAYKQIPNLKVLESMPEFIDAEQVIDKLNPKDQKVIVKSLIAASYKRSWSGPIPPPDILKGYNDCFEGGAKAIYEQSRIQTEHRMEMEKMVMRRELNQSGVGQVIGAVIAISFLAVAGYLISKGHEASGTIIGSVDLVALVTVFVLGKTGMRQQNDGEKSNSKEVAQKD